MQFRQLGKDGPSISVLGYGTWQAGGSDWREISRQTVIEAIRTALNAGVNWLDTAELYGHGRAEELIAEAIADNSDAERPLIFTKVAPRGYGSGVDRDGVHRAAESSLARLRVDKLDLFQVHWFEDPRAVDSGPPPVAVEETWAAMAELVEDGIARHIGVSNVDRATVERCHAIHRVTSVQNEFSMLHRDDMGDLLPWLGEAGIGYLCYSPLASGLLSGAIDRGTTFGQGDWRSGERGWTDFSPLFAPEHIETNLDVVERVGEIGQRFGCSTPDVALSWALDQDGVSAAIIGSCNPRHILQSLESAGTDLSSGARQELHDLVGATAGSGAD